MTECGENNHAAGREKGAFIVHEAASGQAVLHIDGSNGNDPVLVAATGGQ